MKINQNFTGFSPEALLFLQELKENNNKQWFEAHKESYVKYVLEPLKSLVEELGEFMLTIDPYFMTIPSRAVSRIYRDTRFSKNKTPYKIAMWFTFKRSKRDWQDAPAYYFEISATGYAYGMGFYGASPETMRKFREKIKEDEKPVRHLIELYKKQNTFLIEGEKYKKVFYKDQAPEIQDWTQRKNIYFFVQKHVAKPLFSKKLKDELMEGFYFLAPFYQYFQSVKSV